MAALPAMESSWLCKTGKYAAKTACTVSCGRFCIQRKVILVSPYALPTSAAAAAGKEEMCQGGWSSVGPGYELALKEVGTIKTVLVRAFAPHCVQASEDAEHPQQHHPQHGGENLQPHQQRQQRQRRERRAAAQAAAPAKERGAAALREGEDAEEQEVRPHAHAHARVAVWWVVAPGGSEGG